MIFQHSPVLGSVLGGWTLSAGYFQHTGTYVTPTFSGHDPSNTNQFKGSVDRVGNPFPSGTHTITEWFNPRAYAVPKNGTFGSAGYGILEGPGSYVLNAGVYKTFALPKKMSIEFAASFTNILNHPNLGNPNVVITSPSAGKITSQPSGLTGPRAGMLSTRFTF